MQHQGSHQSCIAKAFINHASPRLNLVQWTIKGDLQLPTPINNPSHKSPSFPVLFRLTVEFKFHTHFIAFFKVLLSNGTTMELPDTRCNPCMLSLASTRINWAALPSSLLIHPVSSETQGKQGLNRQSALITKGAHGAAHFGV
eukprot:762402-Pelagomonas_calceolata.AAC.3